MFGLFSTTKFGGKKRLPHFTFTFFSKKKKMHFAYGFSWISSETKLFFSWPNTWELKYNCTVLPLQRMLLRQLDLLVPGQKL